MITDGLHGWVLHKRCSGDTSAQITFFSREKGVICAFSKGGRTPKKWSLLQAFSPLLFSIDTRRDWHYLYQIDTIAPSLDLKGHSLFAGLYINEIIYHGLRQLDPSPVLYDAYEHALYALARVSQRLEIEAILRRWEWQFLLSCGYAFSLTHEAVSQHAIEPEKYYDFIAGDGLILSLENTGVPGQCIIAMANNELDHPVTLRVAKWIMRRAIDHALDGKTIKARKLYHFTSD